MRRSSYARSSSAQSGLSPRITDITCGLENHRLPKKWDSNQASSYLELSQNGLTVSFKRNVSLQGDKDPSGVVRSDYPIPSSIGLYYFEVEIRHGIRGCLGVGLSKEGGDLNRMPGWDPSCFGYHGDDGNFFSACGHGSSYGPKFGTGDVIGCGIDTLLYHVFFTKNGKHLGIAYRGSEPFEKLYPTVGLKTPGEQLHANFGQKSFMFDYDNYRDILYKDKTAIIDGVKMPLNIENNLDKVVLSFLGNCGALKTLQKFPYFARKDEQIGQTFLEKRKEIKNMIVSADYGAAIEERINLYFPNYIERNPKMQLVLLCLRYIDLATSLHEEPSKTPSKHHTDSDFDSCHTRSSLLTHCPMNIFMFLDGDTRNGMLNIEGIVVTEKMYHDFLKSDQLDKLLYIIKMGREIMRLSKTLCLTSKERHILETSVTIILNSNPMEKHPLNFCDRQYIANLIVAMINEHSHVYQADITNVEERVYSQLRGIFIGWKGIHVNASKCNHPSAAISFMRNMVNPLFFAEKAVLYNEEPIEKGGDDGTTVVGAKF